MLKRMRNDDFHYRFYFQDSFYAQCVDVDQLSMIQFDRSVEQVRKIIENPVFKNVEKIIATGCGDSNIAVFSAKPAFAHYLPQIKYQAIEAIELSRHYDFSGDNTKTIALFASKSGGVARMIEAMIQCKNHGIVTVAVTDGKDSEMAKLADVVFYENTPPGDNNAGLRTYYVNVISMIILAASIAEVKTGNHYIAELRNQVQEYHDQFYAEFENISNFCFKTAIRWMDKEYFEITADGPLFWTGKFIQAKFAELSGDVCAVVNTCDHRCLSSSFRVAPEWGEIILADSWDNNSRSIAIVGNAISDSGQNTVFFGDKAPEEFGISKNANYCYVPTPDPDWRFLAALYNYLPGALLADFRHTTIGEPMFRGGFDPAVFFPCYFSAIEISGEKER